MRRSPSPVSRVAPDPRTARWAWAFRRGTQAYRPTSPIVRHRAARRMRVLPYLTPGTGPLGTRDVEVGLPGTREAPPDPGGPITRWHYHDKSGGQALMMHNFFVPGNDLAHAYVADLKGWHGQLPRPDSTQAQRVAVGSGSRRHGRRRLTHPGDRPTSTRLPTWESCSPCSPRPAWRSPSPCSSGTPRLSTVWRSSPAGGDRRLHRHPIRRVPAAR